ncbi:L,D-transpeptidase [Spongiactinospora sp. TRM90649]|uniref:L,D-transpeptidase n=1 Tax=Spongiactinospora sp. TRM90649 TaxID=3031114 RepID=UPI0023F8C977|nr:L,D-transpeptidase [Spongiactinospora sp. TRM90649]MDF5757826.1 L,D-transpeptidase [Spongiactinospora sp. TRM90649]
MSERWPRRRPYRGVSVVAVLMLFAAGSSVSRTAGTISLPHATTFTALTGVARDSAPLSEGTGVVVHPVEATPVRARPGGRPVAVLPSLQLGNPTWVPVVATVPGWIKILLPSRPNRATGWISGTAGGLQVARSPYLVRVETSARRLTVYRSGRAIGRWTVGVGAPKTPTPLGRTFLLASLSGEREAGPPVMPTGTHSRTLDSYGGGPGTVAFHGWPDKSVFGRAVSHGCIRAPDSALEALSKVPLGTVVIITR